MKEITLKSRAKINITLDVTSKREDGYHLVKMIMQTIDLADDVTVRTGVGGNISIKNNLPYLPRDNRNLAYRAAELFFSHTGLGNDGVFINIHKRIPVAAGLAGGSTNGAAVLKALNTLYNTNLSIETLMDIGLKLGADVPYCICGGTMLAEGIGEILTKLSPMPECTVVLCKPPFSVSTAMVYSKLNCAKLQERPDTAGVIYALATNDYSGIVHRMYNVMEDVTGGMHREIGEIKKVLLDCGADGAVMSGSGPSTFGLFSNQENAQKAYSMLKAVYKDTFITKIYN